MENFDTSEIIKYMFGFLLTVGGSYITFVIKSISKDINQMKELLMNEIKGVAEDVTRHRGDLDDLYNQSRTLSERIAVNESELKSLKEEHIRCQANR